MIVRAGAPFLRDACKPNASITSGAMMFGFTQVSESPHKPFLPDGQLPAFLQDLATFMLVRGPFAWLGYGWLGCGDDPRGSCSHGRYVRPAELDADFGEPVGHCQETKPGSGVFRREWTKARVQMDCGVGKYGKASITMKSDDGEGLGRGALNQCRAMMESLESACKGRSVADCDVCAGRRQPALRAAGCTAAE